MLNFFSFDVRYLSFSDVGRIFETVGINMIEWMWEHPMTISGEVVKESWGGLVFSSKSIVRWAAL
jgi:hypothetical protein